MRRGVALALVLLLFATVAAPSVEASHEREERERREPEAPITEIPAPRRASSDTPLDAMRRELDQVAAPAGLTLGAVAGLLLLGSAALAARRALRPKPVKPPRRSFEAGRRRGVAEGMRADLMAALKAGHLGEVQQVAPIQGGWQVAVHRARGTPCEYAAGYLLGLCEGAWAVDVHLAHPVCAGKDRRAACVYVVQRRALAMAAPSRGAEPAEAAWTRG